MSRNLEISIKVIQELLKKGTRTFIVCAGARNAPLLAVLETLKNEHPNEIELLNFFEERSAGFFAFGKSSSDQRPVAVVTTSGTAVAELLPSVIESYYSEVPLVVVSADRPKRYRGTASPQTIEQVGLFSHYLEAQFDLDSAEFDLEGWNSQGPLHLNVCLEEPLETEAPHQEFEFGNLDLKRIKPSSDLEVGLAPLDLPAVIVGPTRKAERERILRALQNFPAPIFFETLSGMRSYQSELNQIQFGERVFQRLLKSDQVKSVLRLGGVPTTRLWRDLESKWSQIPVISISDSGYSGLARPSVSLQGYEHLKDLKVRSSIDLTLAKKLDQESSDQYQRLSLLYPKAEVPLLGAFMNQINGWDHLYLGNSLPVRHFDSMPAYDSVKDVFGNRGANGIDGQLSSFLGWMCGKNKQDRGVGIFGDLTTLYDLTAPWALKWLKSEVAIGIVNNGGGQIFRQVNRKEFFLNEHELRFQKWAEMWNMSHQFYRNPDDKISYQDKTIYEILPDPNQSEEWNQDWKNA